jgi:hypothetical protein
MMEIELGSGWIAHQQCKDSKVDKFLALQFRLVEIDSIGVELILVQ